MQLNIHKCILLKLTWYSFTQTIIQIKPSNNKKIIVFFFILLISIFHDTKQSEANMKMLIIFFYFYFYFIFLFDPDPFFPVQF